MKRELKGSGISFSVISPTYVSHAGAYADILNKSGEKMNTPSIVGEVSPQEVANAVVRSIVKNKTDLIVGSPFLRIFTAVNALMPNFATTLLDLFNISQYSEKLAIIHHGKEVKEK